MDYGNKNKRSTIIPGQNNPPDFNESIASIRFMKPGLAFRIALLCLSVSSCPFGSTHRLESASLMTLPKVGITLLSHVPLTLQVKSMPS